MTQFCNRHGNESKMSQSAEDPISPGTTNISDLFNNDSAVKGCPFAHFAKVRATEGLYWAPEVEPYLVTGSADAVQVFSDPDRFSNKVPFGKVAMRKERDAIEKMSAQDPELQGLLAKTAGDLIDSVAEARIVDAVEALTIPLPVRAIPILLGSTRRSFDIGTKRTPMPSQSPAGSEIPSHYRGCLQKHGSGPRYAGKRCKRRLWKIAPCAAGGLGNLRRPERAAMRRTHPGDSV